MEDASILDLYFERSERAIAEIAAKRGCKESRVKMSLMRTRQMLKRAIEQEGYRL